MTTSLCWQSGSAAEAQMRPRFPPPRERSPVPASHPTGSIAAQVLLDFFSECVTCVCEAVNGGSGTGNGSADDRGCE
jgi:hypothetical protein